MTTKQVWVEVQQRLIQLGILVGTADGVAGPKTLAALRGFQRINSLKVDGDPGPKTLLKLFPVVDSIDRILQGTPEETQVNIPSSAAPVSNIASLRWPSQNEASMNAFFGPKGKNQGTLVLPFPMIVAWNRRQRVKTMTLNKKSIPSAQKCFAAIAEAYTASEIAELGINVFGGSLNVRLMRGGTKWSIHSWGCAIDFDPERNQLAWDHTKAKLAGPKAVTFWKIWEDEGWVSLGRVKDYDWMHVQSAHL